MATYPDLCRCRERATRSPSNGAQNGAGPGAPRPYIHRVNAARTVLLYAVSAIVGILLGLAAAQVTISCTGHCVAQPRFPVWQSGVIGLAGAVVVAIACALLDEEFIPVTRQWLRAARRRISGDRRNRQAS